MKFEKGHPYLGGGGRKGRSGPRKKPDTIVKEAIEDLRGDIPQLIDALKVRGLNGDRESAIYLIDRAIGKPKQQTEIDITGGEQLGAGTVKMIMIATQEYQKKLREGQHAIQGPGDSPKLLEGEEASTKDVQP